MYLFWYEGKSMPVSVDGISRAATPARLVGWETAGMRGRAIPSRRVPPGSRTACAESWNPCVGVIDPMCGVADPMRGVVDAIRGVMDAIRGVMDPIRGVVDPIDGVADPVDGLADPMHGLADPARGLRYPIATLAHPIQLNRARKRKAARRRLVSCSERARYAGSGTSSLRVRRVRENCEPSSRRRSSRPCAAPDSLSCW